MGLFGFVYTALVLCVKGIKNIESTNENKRRRIHSINNGKQTYIDDAGCERLVDNDLKVMKTYVYTKDAYVEYKDDVLKQVGTNNIIRNYSAEKRNIEESNRKSKAILDGKTTYRLGTVRDNYNQSEIRGYRYKDIITGSTYVIRSLNGVNFYMDISSGQFIRETDGEIERNKNKDAHHHDIEAYESLRQRINKEQALYLEKYGKIDSKNMHYRGGKDWYED